MCMTLPDKSLLFCITFTWPAQKPFPASETFYYRDRILLSGFFLFSTGGLAFVEHEKFLNPKSRSWNIFVR